MPHCRVKWVYSRLSSVERNVGEMEASRMEVNVAVAPIVTKHSRRGSVFLEAGVDIACLSCADTPKFQAFMSA